MFSSSANQQDRQSTPPRRTLAGAVLRGVGLTSEDSKMSTGPEDKSKLPRRPIAGSSLRAPKKEIPSVRHRVYERNIPEKDKNSKAQTIGGRPLIGKSGPLSIRGAAAANAAGGSKLPMIPGGPKRDADSKFRGWGSKATEEPMIGGPSNVVLLKNFVGGRYDPQRKFLNLERLADDPFWTTNNIQPPDSPEAAKDVGAVILKLAGQLKPHVETVSLAHNRFKTLRQLGHVSRYLPNLVNLSLEDNLIATSRELAFVAGRSGTTSNLKEIVLTNNVFRNVAEARNNLDGYRSEVMRMFPELRMLDLVPVTKIGFDTVPEVKVDRRKADPAAAPEFSVQMGPSVLPESVKDIVSTFLTTFFTKYDTARESLVEAYAPQATFSYAINTGIPPRARIKKYHYSPEFPHQRNLTWTPWQGQSRNLTKVTQVARSASMLSSTDQEVIEALKKLPSTKHEITGEGAANFLVDAWAVDGVMSPEVSPPSGTALFVTVHGQFAELPAQGIRSFDRTFILAPAPEGSKAQLAGWQVVILSDQLLVRNYSSSESWAPGPIAVQVPEPVETKEGTSKASTPVPPTASLPPAQAAAPTPNINRELLATLPAQHAEVTVQLQMRTGLNTQWAGECLNANNWDLAQALANFQQVKVTMPPEAYV